jgi:hypothetical protein
MEHLFTLMEQVQNKLDRDAAGIDAGSKVNLRHCDWKAVMGEVGRTAQRWKARPNKHSKVMVFIDKVGRHSVAMETWLGLLPAGDYGSRYSHRTRPCRTLWKMLTVVAVSAACSRLLLG